MNLANCVVVGVVALVATCQGNFAYPSTIDAQYVQQLRGNNVACTYLGSLMTRLGFARDKGVPLDDALRFIEETLKQARSDPETFIKTDDDVKYVLDQVRKVWGYKHPPEKAGLDIYNDCMGKTSI